MGGRGEGVREGRGEGGEGKGEEREGRERERRGRGRERRGRGGKGRGGRGGKGRGEGGEGSGREKVAKLQQVDKHKCTVLIKHASRLMVSGGHTCSTVPVCACVCQCSPECQ